MSHTVYIALGSNLGDRAANLSQAVAALAPEVSLAGASPVFETAPWGYVDQPSFLNQVVRGQTALAPLDLLAHLKNIEQNLGREATFRYGPRRIDLDILFYDDQVVDVPGLTIPHPRIPERAFVLAPLACLAPDLRHPVLGKTAAELLADLDATSVSLFKGGES